jgi:hypothetical protein
MSEKNKKIGVCYAITDNGLELPVIDITHPAFYFQISDAELSVLIDDLQRALKVPSAALQEAAQNSLLFRGIYESYGTYTTGIMTYLNTLEPGNLGEGYATPFDHQWAASLTPLTFRWRLRDVGRLLADGLFPLLIIGGGPAIDSLNALIVLKKEHPKQTRDRKIYVNVCDVDRAGPSFGQRALAALMKEGGPLRGLQAVFEYIDYDWNNPERLQPVFDRIGEHDIVIGSSVGALFEYPPDDVIRANLETLYQLTPGDFKMVGPVVRDATSLDPRLKDTEHNPGRPAIRYIGLEKFSKIVEPAGFTSERHLDDPIHQVVSLGKTRTV